MQDKLNLGALQFVISKTWETDNDTAYIASVLLIKCADGLITKVEHISGNVPAIYDLLEKNIRKNNNKIKDINATVGAIEDQMVTTDMKLTDVGVKVKAIDAKVQKYTLYKHAIRVLFEVTQGRSCMGRLIECLMFTVVKVTISLRIQRVLGILYSYNRLKWHYIMGNQPQR